MNHYAFRLFTLAAVCGLTMACDAKQAAPKPTVPAAKADAPTPKADAPAPKVDAPAVKADAPAPKPIVVAQAPAAPAVPAAAPAKAPEPEKTYKVRIVPGEAKAGVETKSIIEVTPLPGYKMNKEFPSKLRMGKAEGVSTPKTEYGRADAEVTEKILRFKVAFTAAEAGKVNLNGSADFSVCNENACKLIRDEKLAWEVAVR